MGGDWNIQYGAAVDVIFIHKKEVLRKYRGLPIQLLPQVKDKVEIDLNGSLYHVIGLIWQYEHDDNDDLISVTITIQLNEGFARHPLSELVQEEESA